MLESMRKHAQGWIAKVILGAIIISFALWGIGDYFRGNQVEAVAEIDGEAIYDVDFAAAYQRQLATYANMLGEQFSKELADKLGVKNETLQTMINRKLMLLEASHLGLIVPDEAVLATVQSTQAFRDGSRFSTARYQALVRQMGFASPRDYENYLRRSIMIDTLQKAIVDSATVSEEEVKARFKAAFEKRVLTALIVSPEAMKETVKVDDAQAREWYEAHQNRYQSPLKVDLAVVDIHAKGLLGSVQVSEDDIARAYEERQSEFGTPEKRRAAHILVRVSSDASQDVVAMAKEKINAAKKRLDAGESFAKVAKDVSDDVTAADGGELGYFARGTMVPEFDAVVFDQLKPGEVSDVVRTKFGFHIIKLEDVTPANVLPLEKVHDKLKAELEQEAAANMAYDLSQDLEDALGREDSLQAAAKSVNLPVQVLGKISADNILANPLFASSDELKQKVFSTMPGDMVDIVEVADGHFVAVEVLKRINPETMPYEEVVKQVYDDVKADMAARQARDVAETMLEQARAGKDVQALAQAFSQPVYTSRPVRSNGEGDDAGWVKAVLSDAFATPEHQWLRQTVPTSKGIAVVFVQEVVPADDARFEEVADDMRQEAIQAKGAVRFARWMASVRERHDIDVHERVLSRF